MKAAVLQALGLANLAIVERPTPEPAPGEVLVRMKAASLNYRDLLTVEGGYGSRQKAADLIMLSDGAGEVVALGSGTSRFRVGEPVIPAFFQDWPGGPPDKAALASGLGGLRDGVLAEYRALPERGLVARPAYLSDVEAASLPCAALTAWSAVIGEGGTRPGDTVLVQGTGGVSLFALLFARLAGARVIATSSSDEKLERARRLGADHVINYRTTPGWGRAARDLTGSGVDLVVEVGGARTLDQSIKAVKVGGRISLVGVLSGPRHELRLPLVVTRSVRLQGITVGSRADFEAMLRAMDQHRLRPVIDRVFAMAEIGDALTYLAAGRHVGKVCLSIP